MHRHHSLGFHSDMLAAIQPCLHSKIHTTQRVLQVCVCNICLCTCNIECEVIYLCMFVQMCMFMYV